MTGLIDLRHAWDDTMPAGAPHIEPKTPPPGPLPADTSEDDTDDVDTSAGDEAGERAGAEVETGDVVKLKARIQDLCRENANHRIKNKELAAERDTWVVNEDELRSARLELAVVKTNLGRPVGQRFQDVDLALSQIDTGAIIWDGEARTFTGLDAALDYVAERYPYLLDTEPKGEAAKRPSVTPAAGSGSAGVRDSRKPNGLDRATLERKFPALKRGR